ncbi:MAG TPA: hypothetical protein PK951_10980 [Chitinophagaceae bacterium]|nr:hypothetical protein [Chitinophagaceae bacterium]
MLEIPFSYNWNNKLDCQAFTTVRIYNPAKHIPGIQVNPILKGQSKAMSTLVAVKPFFLKNVNPFIAFLDTGYDVENFKHIVRNMYPAIDFEQKQLALLLIVKNK